MSSQNFVRDGQIVILKKDERKLTYNATKYTCRVLLDYANNNKRYGYVLTIKAVLA